ncbi:transcriptional regulator, ArsR family [Methanococcus maripaludis C5]|uniref:Transcriptional regulator, ArsR family n=1 Tax=Methanococcus maripaludis (strain C5 / ATCC BAA-1333) TaxID=402880 RepID=A4FWI5_METM5|nr:helix-turn-helix domain-containing protein [Methanococcus maripaludis]ABO34560.1 transcriptional regulator, ArsR family [Methanococcus maripaludis C5]
MFLKILSKSNAKEILMLLNEYDELYFGQIQKELDKPKSNLSRILSELQEESLVNKRTEETDDDGRIPKNYYSLTNLGKMAVEIYQKEDKMVKEKEKKSNDLTTCIIGNNNQNIGNININNNFMSNNSFQK